jgi:hypothetical protein
LFKKAFDIKTEETLVMLRETVTTKSTCDSELHNEHLCFIISQGFHLTDEQEYKALIEEANFRCDRCRRTAKSGANLCVPVPVRD